MGADGRNDPPIEPVKPVEAVEPVEPGPLAVAADPALALTEMRNAVRALRGQLSATLTGAFDEPAQGEHASSTPGTDADAE